MTVRELIEALATRPPEAEVLLSTGESDLVNYFMLFDRRDKDGAEVVILEEY